MKNVLQIYDQPELHNVFFDNYFSSYQLLFDLNQQRFCATGTMRNDCIMKCPVKSMTKMKKSAKRAFDYRSSGPIEVVRWNDNSVATINSNAY